MENAWRIPMDKGAWWATVHGVAKSQTRLSDLSTQPFTLEHPPSPVDRRCKEMPVCGLQPGQTVVGNEMPFPVKIHQTIDILFILLGSGRMKS